MKARSKAMNSVTAFVGLEYIKKEWREVPSGFEEEARRNPHLELQEDDVETGTELDALSLVEVEPVETPAEDEPAVEAPAKRHRRG